jgi:hypothetical protein
MKRLFSVTLLVLSFILLAGATEQPSLIRVKTKQHHTNHHHAHKAAKHHTPKRHHNSV